MSPWVLLALQLVPLLVMAGVLFWFGNRQRKAANKLIAHIKARYPKWIIEFKSDGTSVTHQVNSKEEHEALSARLKS